MRAFIAIELPDEIRGAIYSLGLKVPGKISRVAEQNIHITLQFLGDISEGDAESVMGAVKGIRVEKFTAKADGISYFGGRDIHTVYAKITDNGEITGIYSKLHAALSKCGIKVEQDRQYIPHATIARVKQENAELRKFIGQNSSHYFGSFEVTSICIMESILTEKGPEYTKILEQSI